MFCRNCGNEICDDVVVCPKCGVPVYSLTKEKKFKNGMAIAGFVCAFIIPLLGWIFGGIGLSNASKNNGKGRGLSIAAIIIACVMFQINLSFNV